MRFYIPFILLAFDFFHAEAAEPAIPQPPEIGILYYLHPGTNKLLPLEQQTPTLRAVRAFLAADLQGPASPVRISSTRPTFVIRHAEQPDKTKNRLMLLDSVNGKRTIMMSQGPNKSGTPLPGKDFELEFRLTSPNTYAFRPVNHLAPGEYCLPFGKANLTFLFGVDPGATAPDEPSPEPSTAVAAPGDKRRILETLLQKQLITEADYKAKLAELDGPPAATGPEERLRRLDSLLKRGLISQPEYQKKRAEILAEI